MKRLSPLQEKLQHVNEALLLGSLRQHELTEAAENLNKQLRKEMTERQAAESALRKSEGIYHDLFNSIDEGFCIIEKVEDSPLLDFRYIESNPAFDSQSGMENVRGKTIREMLPDEPEGWCDIYEEVLNTGKSKRFERTLVSRGRALEVFAFRVVDEDHKRVAVLFTDTTQRKLEEEVKKRIAVLSASNQKLEREITRRKTVEKRLLSSEQKEKDLRGRTRQLAHQVLRSREQERLRISRELHDQVVQTLIGINTRLVGLKMQALNPGPAFLQQLSLAQNLVEKSVETVHKLSWDLRPDLLDFLGFIPTLHELLKGFLKETGVRASLTVFADIEKLEDTIRTTLYRVAQEALSNVARHAQATRVEIRIQKLEDSIMMEIVDNGKGFTKIPASKTSGKNARLGLIGMQERIEMVDGTFHIDCEKGRGTSVKAIIPLKTSDKDS